MKHDTLADALSMIKNAENVGKHHCRVPRSKLVVSVLGMLKGEGYIADFKEKARTIEVALTGRINELAVIKPRFPVKKDGCVKFESRYLPSRDIGFLVVSTPEGVISHKKAKEDGSGGRLIAYAF